MQIFCWDLSPVKLSSSSGFDLNSFGLFYLWLWYEQSERVCCLEEFIAWKLTVNTHMGNPISVSSFIKHSYVITLPVFIWNQGSFCECYWSLCNPGKNRVSKPSLACVCFFNRFFSERQNEEMYCHFYCTFRGRGFLRGHADKWLANSFLADCVSLLRHQSSTVNYVLLLTEFNTVQLTSLNWEVTIV